MRNSKNTNNNSIMGVDFFQTPNSVRRLGKQVFIKLPLLHANTIYKPIYINRELYSCFFGIKNINSWEYISKTLINYFNVTIDHKLSNGRQVGWAYIDKQSDPFNFMVGNQGSGRAYYTGKFFNIKGEKTPLATSLKKEYSDGVLSAEHGIWETIVANSLSNTLKNGLSQILAILVPAAKRGKKFPKSCLNDYSTTLQNRLIFCRPYIRIFLSNPAKTTDVSTQVYIHATGVIHVPNMVLHLST